MPSEKTAIAKDTIFYTISQFFSQGIGVITSIIIRNALGPLYMGIWSALKVVLDYAQYTGLGITSAVYCEIPYLRGAGKYAEADEIKNVSFSFNLIVSIIVGSILFLCPFFLGNRYPDYVLTGLRVLAVIVVLTFFYNLVLSILRADKKFITISKTLMLNAILTVIFAASVVYKYGLYGMYVTIPAVLLIASVFMMASEKMKFRIYFNKAHLSRLMKIGIPLFLGGIFYTIYVTVDKIMIIKMLGAQELGYYSLAILMTGVIESFPRLFNIVLFPRVQEKYGEDQSYGAVIKYVDKPTKLVFFTGIIFLGHIYFMISGLVPVLMPKYVPGIVSAKIVLCGFLMFVLSMSSENFILTVRKQVYQIPMLLAATSVTFLLNLYFIKCGFGIMGVALGTGLGYILYFFIETYFAIRHFWSKSEMFMFYRTIMIPYVYILFILLGIEKCFAGKSGIGIMISQMLLYALFSVPLFLFGSGRDAAREIGHLLRPDLKNIKG
jgi:O-antigen/teichoic acid export membrane protein